MEVIKLIELEITSVIDGIVDIVYTAKDSNGTILDVHKFTVAQGEKITFEYRTKEE